MHAELPTYDFATMTDVILAFLDGSRSTSASRVILTRERAERAMDHVATARAALRVAGGLRERGIGAGDIVFIALPSREDYLVPFCGAVLAGCLPCCVPAPGEDMPAPELSNHVFAAMESLTPKALIAVPALAESLQRDPVLAAIAMSVDQLCEAAPLDRNSVHRGEPDDLHHLQLTSGSTGRPKAAALTHRNVLSNIYLTAQAGKADLTKECGVIWLPLFHDMGLIALLSAFVHDVSIVLQPPEDFIRNPLGWLKNISRFGGTSSAAPNFALAYCVRRFRPELMHGVDLSGFRALVVGAERVHFETVRDFVDTFGPYGFTGDMIYPCYGSAELTLAITVPDGRHTGTIGQHVYCDTVDATAVDEHRAPTDPVLSLGPPLPSTVIEVRDEYGNALPEGGVGHIHVKSVCLMRGYYGDPERTALVMRDGFYATGDLGYLRDGELYVLGRIKELIILRGRNYYPHEFEECIARHPHVDIGRVAAFGVADAKLGSERLVVAVEPEDYRNLASLRLELQELLRTEFGFGASEICFVSRGLIPRTTSRKIQRVECARSYTDGSLPRIEVALPAETRNALV
ncbi:AMP-binding protein [Tahibacter amnicola]|uniref:AMP-binding protein n=1 Tax=Tahibacter amnicola TaxID=2976241 RepID=A0ABY6B8S4_9GAMM|nr:AMP-binding protein [Tahibacter amnicola]UXI66182.1 AMP-binding protein [Tahibacter amnicola]